MTIGTTPLTSKETWREIGEMVIFFAALGIEEVEVTYGWGCQVPNLHATEKQDDKYSVLVPLVELVEFLHKNIAQGIYHLGEDNLYIGAQNPVVSFLLCHDTDIHFDADDATLETRMRNNWQARGISVWPKHQAV